MLRGGGTVSNACSALINRLSSSCCISDPFAQVLGLSGSRSSFTRMFSVVR